MLLSPPIESELAQLRAAHPLRFPQSLRVPLVGDDGAPVVAHLVIGNPSGACPGAKDARPVWGQFLASVLRGTPEPSMFRGDLCADVVLYPNPLTEWPQLVARWPGIVGPVAKTVLRKVGALDEMTVAVSGGGFVYSPTAKDRIPFTVRAPDALTYQANLDAIRSSADLWQTACDVVRASVTMVGLEETIARWPGFVLQAYTAINNIAGAAAQVELGE